jgi:prepilin-type N-terminal cleavage/methylation domain-containing protein
MMWRRCSSINKRQRGFTLIELLVALAISGAIAGGISLSIFQTLDYNARGNARMTAVKQVENAIHYIIRDVQMSQVVEPEALPDADGFPLVLTWVEWDNTENVITYSIVGDELRRSHSLNGGAATEKVTARYIDSDPDNTHCEFDEINWVFDLKVTATVTGYPETISEMREIKVTPRPN